MLLETAVRHLKAKRRRALKRLLSLLHLFSLHLLSTSIFQPRMRNAKGNCEINNNKERPESHVLLGKLRSRGRENDLILI